MYGMGGSFGGMNYQSPGSAALAGIQAGFNMVMQGREQQKKDAQQEFENSRQSRRDAMDEAHESFLERHMADQEQQERYKNAYQAHNQWGMDLDRNADQLRQKWTNPDGSVNSAGWAADPDVQAHQKEVGNWNKGRDALMDSAMGPFLKAQQERATTFQTGMSKQDPNFDPSDPKNAQDLHHFVSATTKQDPANFLLGPNGEPSPFQNAQKSLHEGFTNSDAQQLYTGAQSIFGNQFEAGRLGTMDPMGGRITSASLNKDKPFVPTPDGNAVHPVLTLGGETTDGGFTTQPAAAPTKTGFDSPDADLHSFTVKEALDHVGAMGSMQSLLSHPEVQKNLAAAVKNPDQDNIDFAHAYTGRGNKPSLGGLQVSQTNADGSTDHFYRPHLANGGVGPAQLIAHSAAPQPKNVDESGEGALNRMVERGDINPATKLPWTQQDADAVRLQKFQGGGTHSAEDAKIAQIEKMHQLPPGTPGALSNDEYSAALKGAVGIGPLKPSETEAKTEAEIAEAHAMRALSITKGKDDMGVERYTWSDDSAKGTPAAQAHKAGDPVGPRDMGKLQDAQLKAREEAYRTSRGGGPPLDTAAPDPEREQVRDLLGAATKKYGNKYTSKQLIDEEIRLGHLMPTATRFYQSQGGGQPGAIPGGAPAGGINITGGGAAPAKPAPAPTPAAAKPEEPILKSAPFLPKSAREAINRKVPETADYPGIGGG